MKKTPAKKVDAHESAITEALIINGDLSKLHPADKVVYYKGYCERMGLDPFTKPFDLLRLQGKEVLYLNRSGSAQLNRMHGVSHSITSRNLLKEADIYEVTARATLPDGRYTESLSAVSVAGLKGDAYCNALMKAETKAKRRSTIDLVGLGILSEEEISTISNSETVEISMNPVVEIEATPEPAPEPDHSNPDFDHFSNQYTDPEDISLLVDQAESVAELNRLYTNNQALVELSNLRGEFSKRKKQIMAQ
jgi:hypothetical protein